MVLAPFAETKGARRPGRTPATQEITARREFGEKKWSHSPTRLHLMALLKNAASGVLGRFPDLRAVSAHVLPVRSARKTGCGLARQTFLNRLETLGHTSRLWQICLWSSVLFNTPYD